MEEKVLYLACSCRSNDHVIRVTSCEGFFTEKDVIIDVTMSPKLNIFRRFWAGLKYIIVGTNCGYLYSAETVLDVCKVQELIDFLSTCVKNDSRYSGETKPQAL